MDVLAKLFGSEAKVKLIRLFTANPELVLPAAEVAKRSQISTGTASRELRLLESIGFLVKKQKDKVRMWQLDPSFPYLVTLRPLVKSNLLARRRQLARAFGRCGRLQLLLLAGVFIEHPDSRVDVLVVGEGMQKRGVERIIHDIEAEIGTELNYALLDTADFKYRLSASDKFVRDMLDYPHDVVLDKIGL